jgi:hypothetical protein
VANQRFFGRFYDGVADIRLEAAPETVTEAFAEAAAAIGGEAKAATLSSTSSDATSSSLPVDNASSFLFVSLRSKKTDFHCCYPGS